MDSERVARSDEDDRSSETDEHAFWDAGYEPSDEAEYECLDCGVIVVATEHPLTCPTCDATLRNRSMPIE